MKRLAIIGSGDLGQQIAHHARLTSQFEVVGFFDDFETPGTIKHGHAILGVIEKVENDFRAGVFDTISIAVGYKHFEKRKSLFQKFKGVIPLATIVHRSVAVDPTCKIGEGVVIYPGCVLDMNAVIADNVLLNVGCAIAHDSSIGAHSFLSPAVKVAGFVEIGSGVSLGIGTIVIDRIRISDSVRTGAGAVVVDNLVEPGLYLGVPAKLRKK